MKRTFVVLGCLAFVACMDSDSGITQVDALAEVPLLDTFVADTYEPDTYVPDTFVQDLGPPACEPGDGCFGEECDGPDDCLSGICSTHMGEKVCSKTCDEECPAGWTCTLVGSGGADGQYVCLSNYPVLCWPCLTAEGCLVDTPNACVNYPDGSSFCGGACSVDEPCPEGFDCQEVDTTAGVTSFQCVAQAGTCECSALAIESNLATACENANDYGSCGGLRACTEEGLQDCDAASPAAEECNGVDDNCDGSIDEGTCDDGNACTEDVCDGAAGCTYTPLTGGECLDGSVCTETDHCEDGVCVGVPVDCDDENVCTTDTCDGELGCAYASNFSDCDDGDSCTLGDTCKEGACAAGPILACDDNNPCTDDGCGVEGCVNMPNNAECDDANACTSASSCSGGACVVTEALACDDANDCTTDSCNPASGCVNANNTLPCNDGDLCTVADLCTDGACAAGVASLPCDDGNPCTDDSCDPAAGCVFSANVAPCDDKNDCTATDACSGGACLGAGPLGCDDGNPCTQDSCLLDGGCANVNIDGACDDGDACTSSDLCLDGACQSGVGIVCDDANPCTDDSCAGGQCVFAANGEACDDGNACTEGDACEGGGCKPIGVVDCDDGEICTTDYCDLADGCAHDNNALPCSDGDPCSVGDTCADGSCAPGESAFQCDDANLCTDDSCDPETGCVFTPNVSPCDDGSACTTSDTCLGGSCASGPAPNCNDDNPCTDDSCDPEIGCVNSNNVIPCDDGSECTTTDTCAAGACEGGAAPNCNDGNLCTDDPCDPGIGCVNNNNAEACDDGDPCTLGDACADGACASGQVPLDCSDALYCNGEEACELGNGCVAGNPPVADDQVACTVDVCHEDLDQIVSTPDDSLCSVPPGAICKAAICNADVGCILESLADCCGNGILEANEGCDGEVGCLASCKWAATCLDILNAGEADGDGVYTLDPDGVDGNPAFNVHCDMAGGGWTLAVAWSSTMPGGTFGDFDSAGDDPSPGKQHAIPFKQLPLPSEYRVSYLGDGSGFSGSMAQEGWQSTGNSTRIKLSDGRHLIFDGQHCGSNAGLCAVHANYSNGFNCDGDSGQLAAGGQGLFVECTSNEWCSCGNLGWKTNPNTCQPKVCPISANVVVYLR